MSERETEREREKWKLKPCEGRKVKEAESHRSINWEGGGEEEEFKANIVAFAFNKLWYSTRSLIDWSVIVKEAKGIVSVKTIAS